MTHDKTFLLMKYFKKSSKQKSKPKLFFLFLFFYIYSCQYFHSDDILKIETSRNYPGIGYFVFFYLQIFENKHRTLKTQLRLRFTLQI